MLPITILDSWYFRIIRFINERLNLEIAKLAKIPIYSLHSINVIATLTILDALVRHHDLTSGTVTIALDGESTLIQSCGDLPLSVDKSSFDYLQVICGWIKLSPFKFNICYVKGHQTGFLRKDQLDWLAKRNEGSC